MKFVKIEIKKPEDLKKKMQCNKCHKVIEYPYYICKDCKLEHLFYLNHNIGFVDARLHFKK